MATPKYTALATITLSSTASSVTFGSIPAGYRDLYVVISGTTTSDPEVPLMVLNGDATASNYSRIVMYGLGSGSGASAASATNEIGSFGTARATWFGELMDYSATDKHKTIIYRQDKPDLIVAAGAFRWANTAAITSVKIDTTSNTFTVGSTFDLFGVK